MLSTLNLSIAHNLDALDAQVDHLRDTKAAGEILAAELAAALAGARSTDQVLLEISACLGRYRDGHRKARQRLYRRCKRIDARHDKILAVEQLSQVESKD